MVSKGVKRCLILLYAILCLILGLLLSLIRCVLVLFCHHYLLFYVCLTK